MSKEQVTQAEVNIGIIGHVDHGKTSIVKALTGKWTDTHSEEMKKGISIRLGYSDAKFYKCKNCSPQAYSSKPKCEKCGKRIEIGRLLAMPIAQYCLSCSKKSSKK